MLIHRNRSYDGRRLANYVGHVSQGIELYPAAVTGLLSWWKADGTLWQDTARTTAVTADGDPVGCMDDVQGTNNLLRPTNDTTRPLYKTSIQAGKPCLLFDGSNDTLFKAFTLNQPCTIFIVYASVVIGSSGSNDYIFDGNNTAARLLRTDGPSIIASAGTSLFGVTDSRTDFRINTVVFNSTASRIGVNGLYGASSTGNAGSTNPGGFSLAARGNNTRNTNIYFAEAMIYNVAIDISTQTKLENYLKNRWNLTAASTS